MRVHLYEVCRSDGARPLEDVLEQLHATPLEERLRSIGYQEIRLEDIRPPGKVDGTWRLDFCKLRNQGPGRASPKVATQSFELQQGERFAEETAALFDPASGFLAVQYNHFGPRSASLGEYLSIYLAQGERFELRLQLDPTAQARLKKKVQFTRAAFRVAPAKLSAAWRNNNVAMHKAIQVQQDTYGGDWISVEVNLEQRSRDSLKLADKLKGMLGLAEEPRDAVARVEVAGRDDRDLNIDVVDLIEEKLEKTYTGLPLDIGLRISAEDRWKKLEEAMKSWKAGGIVP